MIRILLILGALLLSAAQANAANIYVCAAAGSTADNDCGVGAALADDYTTVAAAVAAASDGDTIYLKAGETFSEATVTLPNKGAMTTGITIRCSTDDSLLPPTGHRITPSYNSLMPIWKASGSSNTPAVKTAASAQDYTFKCIRFQGDGDHIKAPIQLGNNDDNGQTKTSQEPHDFVFDQIIVEGHDTALLRRGMEIHASNVTVKNSYFYLIGGLGNDGQAIFVGNSTGTITVDNNFISGGTESILVGGTDPVMQTNTKTGMGSTTTVLVYDPAQFCWDTGNPTPNCNSHSETDHVFGNAASLVGHLIAVQTGSTTREHRTVTAVDSGANTITVTPALSQAPASGLDLRWGVIPDSITIQRNYITKPANFWLPTISSPTAVTIQEGTSSGTLAAGTHSYEVRADGIGQGGNGACAINTNPTCARSATVPVSITLGATGSVTITWTAVSTATRYRIFKKGVSTATCSTVTSGIMHFDVASGTTTWTDDGTCGTNSGSIAGPTRPALKNGLQLKFGTNVTITKNIVEYVKAMDGSGEGMWLKSVNQDDQAPFAITKTLSVTYNVIRNTNGCILISSAEENATSTVAGAPANIQDVTISNNLCYGTSDTWSGNVSGSNHAGPLKVATDGNTSSLALENLTFEHNTLIGRTSNPQIYVTSTKALRGTITIRSNVFGAGSQGVKSDVGGAGTKTGSTAVTNSAIDTFTHNILANQASADFASHTNNQFPSESSFRSQFTKNDPGLRTAITDWAFVTGSTYLTAAHDGTMIGADITTLNNNLIGVVEGVPASTPVISQTEVPQGTVGVAYSTCFTSTGGTGTKTWSVSSSSLPTGLSLSSTTGCVTGTPSGAGTSTPTIRVTDSLNAYHELAFSFVIAAAAAPCTIQTSSLANGRIGEIYSEVISATGGTAAPTFTVTSGTKPPGLNLAHDTGAWSGVPLVSGTYTFVVTADCGATTTTQSYTVAIAIGTTPNPDASTRHRRSAWQELRTYYAESCSALTTDTYPDLRAGDLCYDTTLANHFIIRATSPTVTVRAMGPPKLALSFAQGVTEFEITNCADNGCEFGSGGNRIQVDLADKPISQCRIQFYLTNASSVADTKLRLEYSTDNSAFSEAAATADAGSVSITGSTGAWSSSSWFDVASGMLADVWLRIWQTDGDGADDTAFRTIRAECR